MSEASGFIDEELLKSKVEKMVELQEEIIGRLTALEASVGEINAGIKFVLASTQEAEGR